MAVPSLLLVLFLLSLYLSWWASILSLVKLPAADLWQHVQLINQSASGHLNLATLLEKHNLLHFIPIPKLIYALDIMWSAGSGQLTAMASAGFTLLCCLMFSKCIFAINGTSTTEKITLSLLSASWLVCILQWESFVNPANLQWSGINAGLAMMAFGLKKHPVLLVTGALIAVGCGSPWWLLVAGLALSRCSRTLLAYSIALLLVTTLCWETLNILWWKSHPPLPFMVIHSITPFTPEQTTNITASFFSNPVDFYWSWLRNLLVFNANFCMPPLEGLLSPTVMASISLLPVAIFFCFKETRDDTWPLQFLVVTLLLTALSAGIIRSHLPTAYTLRFANAGLLMVSSYFVLGYHFSRKHLYSKTIWWLAAILYTSTLAISSTKEAANVVHDSNQRRLSQVAYALDIKDARATSEMPFAPLMELSYQEISERKSVLADHQIGIYASREHQIFSGTIDLPRTEVNCNYSELHTKPIKNDHNAQKITGQTVQTQGDAMTSVLFRDASGARIGYGIYQIPGQTLGEQWHGTQHWSGFVRLPTGSHIEVIAYNMAVRCQTFSLSGQNAHDRLEK